MKKITIISGSIALFLAMLVLVGIVIYALYALLGVLGAALVVAAIAATVPLRTFVDELENELVEMERHRQ